MKRSADTVTTGPAPSPRRLAVALLRLVETGDDAGARVLLAGLDAGQLRAVLLEQTQNVGLIFEGAFAEIVEQQLPAIAEARGLTRGDVVADYLDRVTLRFALAELGEQP